MNTSDIKIGFFGTPEHAVAVLNKLKTNGYDICFVVTTPDKPKGRKLILAPSPAKVWAEQEKIPVLQPETLKDNASLGEELKKYGCDVFVVIAYGKIIPESILDIPKKKSLNIHGSILPEFRGASPIENAILQDKKNTGVSIIRMDSLMDHGPILATKEVIYEPWPPTAEALGERIVDVGAQLLIDILPDWIRGKIIEKEQNHSAATLTRKITKEDGLLDFSADPYLNFRKIQAYHEWPQAYFFTEHDGKKIRIKVTGALFKESHLSIEKIIPEGGKEMRYEDFKRGNKQ